MSLPDCDVCDNKRKIPGGDDGYKRCECVVKHRVKTYLSPLGQFNEPDDKLVNSFEAKRDSQSLGTLKQDLFIDIQQSVSDISLLGFNGFLAHLLLDVYPVEYRVQNIDEAWTYIINDRIQVYNYKDELLIITGGLPEEYEGKHSDDNGNIVKWTDDAFTQTGKQIIGYRLREGLPTWYVSVQNPYNQLGQFLVSNNFTKLSISGSGVSDPSEQFNGAV